MALAMHPALPSLDVVDCLPGAYVQGKCAGLELSYLVSMSVALFFLVLWGG
jgi:hypothetical protein